MLDDENEQKGGGLRIFVADSPQVGELYNAPSKHDAPQGAFEQDADVLMFGAREGEGSHYFAGTVIHELTHMAARILYGQETIPCPPDPTAGYFDANGKMKPEMKDDPYVEAIMKDMREISLCEANDPVENEVLRTMAGRMNDSSYRNRGDLAFLQEFLVGVPQMITEFGEDAVTKLSPELANYFSDTFLDKCRDTIASDERYADIYSEQFDNTALNKTSDRRPPVRPPAPETWLDNGNAGTKSDAIAKKIKQYYTSQHGDVVVPPEGKAIKTSLPYSTESFAIPQRYQADVTRKMQVITKALQENLSDEDLPEQVSADVIRNLVKDMTALAHTSSERELKKVVRGRVAGFKREAAKTYLEREVALGHELTNEQVAEIVLMRGRRGLAGGPPHGRRHPATRIQPQKAQRPGQGDATQDRRNHPPHQVVRRTDRQPRRPGRVPQRAGQGPDGHAEDRLHQGQKAGRGLAGREKHPAPGMSSSSSCPCPPDLNRPATFRRWKMAGRLAFPMPCGSRAWMAKLRTLN